MKRANKGNLPAMILLFVLLMLMVAFVILSTSYDAAHPDIRWIRQQLGM